VDEVDRLRTAEERLLVGLLARAVMELTAIVGQLNALVGMETGENTERHIKIKEALFDVAATVTRVGDHFAPPRPPEEKV
jgi:hypothetical protein